VAQGILAVEYRQDDCTALGYLGPLSLAATEVARLAERAVLAALEGGCQLPLGAYCRPNGTGYEMKGVVLSLDGQQIACAEMPVDPLHPIESGQVLANAL